MPVSQIFQHWFPNYIDLTLTQRKSSHWKPTLYVNSLESLMLISCSVLRFRNFLFLIRVFPVMLFSCPIWLVTSNFFFSHNVFKSCLLLIRQNEYLWSKGLCWGVLYECPILCSFTLSPVLTLLAPLCPF